MTLLLSRFHYLIQIGIKISRGKNTLENKTYIWILFQKLYDIRDEIVHEIYVE